MALCCNLLVWFCFFVFLKHTDPPINTHFLASVYRPLLRLQQVKRDNSRRSGRRDRGKNMNPYKRVQQTLEAQVRSLLVRSRIAGHPAGSAAGAPLVAIDSGSIVFVASRQRPDVASTLLDFMADTAATAFAAGRGTTGGGATRGHDEGVDGQSPGRTQRGGASKRRTGRIETVLASVCPMATGRGTTSKDGIDLLAEALAKRRSQLITTANVQASDRSGYGSLPSHPRRWLFAALAVIGALCGTRSAGGVGPIVHDDLSARLRTALTVSSHLCEGALERSRQAYAEDLPLEYGAITHAAHLARAEAEFSRLTAGPAVGYYASMLGEAAEETWSAGRIRCDVISLTGHPCTLRVERDGSHSGGTGVDCHDSAFVALHACNCGHSTAQRRDPFSFDQAHAGFFEATHFSACCAGRETLVTAPDGAWSLLDLGAGKVETSTLPGMNPDLAALSTYDLLAQPALAVSASGGDSKKGDRAAEQPLAGARGGTGGEAATWPAVNAAWRDHAHRHHQTGTSAAALALDSEEAWPTTLEAMAGAKLAVEGGSVAAGGSAVVAVGLEYECPLGHRFFGGMVDNESHSTDERNGGVLDAAALARPHPILVPCATCATLVDEVAASLPTIAQLQRMYVATPPTGSGLGSPPVSLWSAVEHFSVVEGGRGQGSMQQVAVSRVGSPVPLPAGRSFCLRLPYAYAGPTGGALPVHHAFFFAGLAHNHA